MLYPCVRSTDTSESGFVDGPASMNEYDAVASLPRSRSDLAKVSSNTRFATASVVSPTTAIFPAGLGSTLGSFHWSEISVPPHAPSPASNASTAIHRTCFIECLRKSQALQGPAEWPILVAREVSRNEGCLLYTSDAADERSSVDLGGRRIIKKKKVQ